MSPKNLPTPCRKIRNRAKPVTREPVAANAHIVGISSQAAGHKTLIPQLIADLRRAGAADVLVVCGGVVPPGDHAFLRDAGVAAIFGPGTNIQDAANEILGLLAEQRQAA